MSNDSSECFGLYDPEANLASSEITTQSSAKLSFDFGDFLIDGADHVSDEEESAKLS